MTFKPFLAVVASAVAGFLLGWLLYGVLFSSFFEANMAFYEGLMNEEPPMWGYIIGNLLWGTLFVYIFHSLAGIRSFGKGYLSGLIITFLVTLSFDLYFFTGMNLWTIQAMILDVVINAVAIGGPMAGVAALVLGTGRKK